MYFMVVIFAAIGFLHKVWESLWENGDYPILCVHLDISEDR